MRGQRNQDAVIQSFHAWENVSTRKGVQSRDTQGAAPEVVPYMPLSTVKLYMMKGNAVEELLKALYHEASEEAPSPQNVKSLYLRPFAILISIGYGDHIHLFTQHSTLEDAKLPFTSRPDLFPSSPDDDLWERFSERQWKYYPKIFKHEMDVVLPAKRILPLEFLESPRRGGTSSVRKFTLDSEYDELTTSPESELVDQGGLHSARASPRPWKIYALKCLRGNDALHYCKTEKIAYRNLNQIVPDSSNFPRFYGNFQWGDKFFLILDFADMGTLEDWITNCKPPETARDRLEFWKEFLSTLRGLHRIHNITTSDNDDDVILGWHQDLKPQNILLRSRGKASISHCDFLIADFGLSHFRKNRPGNGVVLDFDTAGTNTYGAPETFRFRGVESDPLQVGQLVDVWSLGCILSETALWAVFGPKRVGEYRRRREFQAREKLGKYVTAIFHDGEKVLPAVEESHASVMNSLKTDDVATRMVLSDLVPHMLLPAKDRKNMHHLLGVSIDIIKKAERALQDMAPGDTISKRPTRPIDTSHNPTKGGVPDADNILPQGLDASVPHPPSDDEQQVQPKWPLEKALRWRRSKTIFSRPELPHKATLEQLRNMEHIFLIDNAETMGTHRMEIGKVVEVLAYVAKRQEASRISMYFTTSGDKVEGSKKTKKLSELLGKVDFRGKSNIALKIDDHLGEFMRYRLRYNSNLSDPRERKKVKRLNIYVLTNGLSVDPEAEHNIIRSVKRLQLTEIQAYHIGIQFIRFGNDPRSKRRLERLDNLDRHSDLELWVFDYPNFEA